MLRTKKRRSIFDLAEANTDLALNDLQDQLSQAQDSPTNISAAESIASGRSEENLRDLAQLGKKLPEAVVGVIQDFAAENSKLIFQLEEAKGQIHHVETDQVEVASILSQAKEALRTLKLSCKIQCVPELEKQLKRLSTSETENLVTHMLSEGIVADNLVAFLDAIDANSSSNAYKVLEEEAQMLHIDAQHLRNTLAIVTTNLSQKAIENEHLRLITLQINTVRQKQETAIQMLDTEVAIKERQYSLLNQRYEALFKSYRKEMPAELASQLVSLKKALSKEQEDHASARASKLGLEHKIVDLSAQNAHLQGKVDKYDRQLPILVKESKSQRAYIAQLEDRAFFLQSKLDAFIEDENGRLAPEQPLQTKGATVETQAEAEGLGDCQGGAVTRDRGEALAAGLRQEIAALQAKVEALERENTDKTTELQLLHAENQDLRLELDTAESQPSEDLMHATQLQEDLENALREREGLKEEMHSEVALLTHDLRTLQDAQASKDATIARLTEQAAQQAESIASLKEENMQLHAIYEEAKNTLESLEQDHARSANAQTEVEARKVAQVAIEMERLKDKALTAESERGLMEMRMKVAERALAESEAELRRAQDDFEKEIEEMSREIGLQVAKTRNEMGRVVAEKEQEACKLRETLKAMEASAGDKESKIEELELEMSQIQLGTPRKGRQDSTLDDSLEVTPWHALRFAIDGVMEDLKEKTSLPDSADAGYSSALARMRLLLARLPSEIASSLAHEGNRDLHVQSTSTHDEDDFRALLSSVNELCSSFSSSAFASKVFSPPDLLTDGDMAQSSSDNERERDLSVVRDLADAAASDTATKHALLVRNVRTLTLQLQESSMYWANKVKMLNTAVEKNNTLFMGHFHTSAAWAREALQTSLYAIAALVQHIYSLKYHGELPTLHADVQQHLAALKHALAKNTLDETKKERAPLHHGGNADLALLGRINGVLAPDAAHGVQMMCDSGPGERRSRTSSLSSSTGQGSGSGRHLPPLPPQARASAANHKVPANPVSARTINAGPNNTSSINNTTNTSDASSAGRQQGESCQQRELTPQKAQDNHMSTTPPRSLEHALSIARRPSVLDMLQ